jgi:hypothetical protein
MAVYRRAPSLWHRTLIAALALLAASGCAGTPEQPDNARICRAYAAQEQHLEVLASGSVVALLGERAGPSGEHEGFLMRLDGGCDILLRVEMNTDLAGPVPLRPHEHIEVKGEYETDATGGVIHWTHRDPRGRHIAGYILAAGKSYQ